MNNSHSGHGGPRQGAGRRKGSSRFSSTTPMTQLRIPACDKAAVIDFVHQREAARRQSPPETSRPAGNPLAHATPIASSHIAAGFPSPADDYTEDSLDLNRYLIEDAAATFMVRVTGQSMINAGIAEGDLLVVNRAKRAKNGDIVVAQFNNEFTVKRLHKTGQNLALLPENPDYPTLQPDKLDELSIWGVVTACIKKF